MPTRLPRKAQALEHRNSCVEACQQIVGPIASHYAACSPEPREDLRQVGMLGLIRAVELYDKHSAVPFEAYARQHIRGAILHYLRDLAPVIRLPRRQQERLQQRRRLQNTLWGRLGRQPSGVDLRQAMGLNERQWQQLEGVPAWSERQPLEEIEQLSHEQNNLDPTEADVVLDSLKALEPRRRSIVEQVVLEGLSLRETARRQGSSASTVHRLLHQALAELRTRLDQCSVSAI